MIQHNKFFQDIYSEVGRFYKKLQPKLGDKDYGFKILNGPPHSRPPVLLISYQPGGREYHQEKYKEYESTWPKTLEHTYETKWRLSQQIGSIFEPFDGMPETCVSLNTVFFRAPSVQKWIKALSEERRQKTEAFCVECVLRMLKQLQPGFVLINGLGALKLLDPKWQEWQTELTSNRNITLVRRGQL
ncbi:MAG: hypothetical protein M3Y50_04390, partial [Acidobacteriota bacterium]|nr:hypothetical protein [Acidobacteriota bacterium]